MTALQVHSRFIEINEDIVGAEQQLMATQSPGWRLRSCLDLALFEPPDRAAQDSRPTQPLKETSSERMRRTENAFIGLLLDRFGKLGRRNIYQ